jgi:hypothetical protein
VSEENTVKTRLDAFLKEKFRGRPVRQLRLVQATKGMIHKAIRDSKETCEMYGFFLTVVEETGNLISAKLFKPADDYSHIKTPQAYIGDTGLPLNLLVGLRPDGKVNVDSFVVRGGSRLVVSSDKYAEIQDAVIAEVERYIQEGVDWLCP